MDAMKTLADAIKTIGRTLPVGMEVFFFREAGSFGARMTIQEPSGKTTEYAFIRSDPLPTFALQTLLRESQIEKVLRDLLTTIELHTDCMSGQIDLTDISDQIESAERLLAEGWEPDDNHPANSVDSQPAIVFYPAGSLGEPIEEANHVV